MEAYNELYMAMEKAVLASAMQPNDKRVTYRSPFNILALTTTNQNNNNITRTNPSVFQHKSNQPMFPWPLVSLSLVDADADNLDSFSVAAAVALFNMGLACHQALFAATGNATTTPTQNDRIPLTEVQRGHLLAQAEFRYLQAYEMGRNYDVEVLNVALLINLMEIAYERGDLNAVHYWSLPFFYETKRLSSQNPLELLQCIWTAQLYFTVGLVAARAA